MVQLIINLDIAANSGLSLFSSKGARISLRETKKSGRYHWIGELEQFAWQSVWQLYLVNFL